MSIDKAVACGLSGNEISKKITGTDEVSPERTVIATTAGATTGAVVSGALIVTGVAATPVVIPLAVASGVIAGIASLFR